MTNVAILTNNRTLLGSDLAAIAASAISARAYARSKPAVWFARKDEIATWAAEHRAIAPIYDRGAGRQRVARLSRLIPNERI